MNGLVVVGHPAASCQWVLLDWQESGSKAGRKYLSPKGAPGFCNLLACPGHQKEGVHCPGSEAQDFSRP